MIPTFDDAIESSNNSFLRKTVPEELKEQQRLLQKEKIDNNKMESIIVLLKQIIIPLVISIENAKDKHNDMQDLIKVVLYINTKIANLKFRRRKNCLKRS